MLILCLYLYRLWPTWLNWRGSLHFHHNQVLMSLSNDQSHLVLTALSTQRMLHTHAHPSHTRTQIITNPDLICSALFFVQGNCTVNRWQTHIMPVSSSGWSLYNSTGIVIYSPTLRSFLVISLIKLEARTGPNVFCYQSSHSLMVLFESAEDLNRGCFVMKDRSQRLNTNCKLDSKHKRHCIILE